MKTRTLTFAKDILKVVEKLPARTGASVIREQVVRSGTSVGANFHEADAALTQPDRLKSLVTARKEVHETAYWLSLAQLRWPTTPGMDHALRSGPPAAVRGSAIMGCSCGIPGLLSGVCVCDMRSSLPALYTNIGVVECLTHVVTEGLVLEHGPSEMVLEIGGDASTTSLGICFRSRQGVLRASLTADAEGEVALFLLDRQGRERAAVGWEEQGGEAMFATIDSNGKVVWVSPTR